MPLLNYYSQTKMAKGERFGYKTAILHFAPFKLSGKNVCPKATTGPAGCVEPCLNTSGRGQMNSVQQARINKRKRKLNFNAADARNWFESRADQGGILICLLDGTFSPGDVAKEISKYTKEQEDDRTLSLRTQRNADWIKCLISHFTKSNKTRKETK